MVTCLIGGGHHLSEELADVNAALARYIKPTDRLVVIPFATEEHKYDRWMQSVVYNYQKLGITDYAMVRYDQSTEEIVHTIESADVLFLAGGRTERLLEQMRDKRINSLIHTFHGVVIGYSAGALALCVDAITTRDEDYPETFTEKGLGRVDFNVEVHYRGEIIDEELLPLSYERDIYAMPDGAAIIVDQEGTHFINNISTFSRGHKL